VNVLLYIDTFEYAGTESHVETLASALRRSSVNAIIGCPQASALETRAIAAGLPTMQIGSVGSGRLEPIRTLRKVLRSGAVDVVHTHNGRTSLAAAVAVRLAGRGRCVATHHFLQPARTARSGAKSVVSKLAHGWVNRHTHAHIAVSQAACDGMVARGEAVAGDVDVVANGIHTPDAASLTPAQQIRQELSVPDGAVLLACVCRLEPEKDVNTLIVAMPLLPATPVFRLVIAGSGSQEDGIRAKFSDWGLDDCVTFLGFRKDAMSLIGAADVFVLPSKAEPFGLVLLEAMSLAKPVVSTAAGGPLEIVQDRITGRLVPPSSAGALAAALQELILDPAGRSAMGEQGRRRFVEHFTDERMAAETLNVYRRVLGLGNQPDDVLKNGVDAAATLV
jgi:glycosyltransferase involved in cell wall biosynthesis